ncbi:flagellar motor protein MotB [Paenibacillus protaetiae]|uniref:Flagellar motor protein MotB n=1 Tax=Paenibacillus protaetiae TaxID=2509456 RepID=A0A4P6EZY0_9BACL|nr:flagellar motor protein MotB [Paenibacillus protaetiae]QAY67379.1 flagellar motor protein MotB [Paenibacillus protaetiae]
MSKKRRHEEHDDDHPNESWLLPYSDLMTLLLALFIVLYSMSSVDVKKFEEMSQAFKITFNNGNGLLQNPSVVKAGEDPEKKKQDADDQDKKNQQSLAKQEQEDLEKLKKQVDEYIKSHGLTSDLATKLNQSQLMITISDKALFASGSAEVKPESRSLANAISTMLQNYTDYEIVVSGHTDNQPISTQAFKSNWDLSSSRAIRFMDILLQNPKLKPERFSAIGYGEYRPVDTNDTEAGRAKNRRVEVSILRKYVDPDKTEDLSANPAK